MSRFEEVVNEAIDDVVLHESLRAEALAGHIAERVRERQEGLRAEVRIAARYPETVPTPASGLETQEIYTLFGTAVASERGTRTLTGVEAQGMTACPCAQGLLESNARERLVDDGFTDDEIERIFASVPVATHNQRGIGSLHIGRPEGVEAADRRPRPAAHRRGVDELRDLRADEALRRGGRGREGPSQPALRRGRRPRDGPPRRRRLPAPARRRLRARPPGEPGDDPPPLRRRRALRPARRDPRRARDRRALAPSHDQARVAGGPAAARRARQSPSRPGAPPSACADRRSSRRPRSR